MNSLAPDANDSDIDLSGSSEYQVLVVYVVESWLEDIFPMIFLRQWKGCGGEKY